MIRYLLIATLASSSALAQELDFKATEVAPNLYMLEGVGGFTGGNIALSVGDDGVVLIDDALGGDIDPKLAAAIDEITGETVDFVINTHVHGDHTGGNAALADEGATIVAHENIRKRLLATEETPAKALPVLTFTEAVTFHLNGNEAHVFHAAAAHTDGDAAIHFRNVNVIHTGDVLFNKVYPYIDLDNGGSVAGYIAAQERVYAMADDETKIIPGHGPLATRADLAASTAMLRESVALVKPLVAAGKSEEEVLAANPLAKFDADWTWGFINTERMTRTIYRDLAKAE